MDQEEMLTNVRQLLEVLVGAQAAEWARQGQWQHAEAFLRPLAYQPKASPFVLDLLAKVLAQQGRLDEAKALWHRASITQPDNEAFRRAIARCEQFKPLWTRLTVRQIISMAIIGAWFMLTIGLVLNNRLLKQQLVSLNQDNRLLKQQLVSLGQRAKSSVPKISSPPPHQYAHAIVKAFRTDAILCRLNIVVKQDGSVIQLFGEIPNLWLRFHAERLARRAAPKAMIDISGLRLPTYYEVKQGDCLWQIAQHIYGNPLLWKELANANGLKPPYYIHPRQRLRLPQ